MSLNFIDYLKTNTFYFIIDKNCVICVPNFNPNS